MSETTTVYTYLARGEGESFEAYKIRRKAMNAAVKALKRGKLFHDSYYDDTYVNKEKQALKAARKLKGVRE